MSKMTELTTTIEGISQPHFDPMSLREVAADALKVAPDRVALVGVRGPTELLLADGKTPMRRYTWMTDWEALPNRPIPQPPPTAKVEWPKPSPPLARGARWHGTVPDADGKPVEALLISNGKELVSLEGAEGRAIQASLAEGV